MLYQLSYFPTSWKQDILYHKTPRERKGVFAKFYRERISSRTFFGATSNWSVSIE